MNDLKPWQWLLIGSAAVLVALCVLGSLLVLGVGFTGRIGLLHRATLWPSLS